MGSWLSNLPNLNIFGKSTFKSNCCNKNQDISFSYTTCIYCHGSGKLFLKSLEHNNIYAN